MTSFRPCWFKTTPESRAGRDFQSTLLQDFGFRGRRWESPAVGWEPGWRAAPPSLHVWLCGPLLWALPTHLHTGFPACSQPGPCFLCPCPCDAPALLCRRLSPASQRDIQAPRHFQGTVCTSHGYFCWDIGLLGGPDCCGGLCRGRWPTLMTAVAMEAHTEQSRAPSDVGWGTAPTPMLRFRTWCLNARTSVTRASPRAPGTPTSWDLRGGPTLTRALASSSEAPATGWGSPSWDGAAWGPGPPVLRDSPSFLLIT